MSAVMRDVPQLRVPPQSVEAEQSVLGALMIPEAGEKALPKIADWLSPEDFYRRDHAAIYRAILALAEKGKPFDVVTVGEWLEGSGQPDSGAYVIELASTTPSTANIVAYAEIVREQSKRRQAIEIGTGIVNAGFDLRDSGEIVANAIHDLSQLRGDPRAGGLAPASAGLGDWYADLHARYESGNKVTGLPYPWADVNAVTHGLQPGELTIIAARPSMGKSVMGLNLAMFSALRGVNTAFFSLEMTTRQVNRRSISALAEIPHDWLLAPDRETEAYWPRVADAVRKLKGASLLVDETAGLNTAQFVARARRAHMQKPLELIVLDHLHDMDFPGKRDMRHEVGEAVAAMKSLGKEFGCPVVGLAQLNRGVEGRADKRPQMSDLRESGEIEQKADVIWFLYREDYYSRNTPGYVPRHDVELILGKGRDLRVAAPVVLREDYAHMALRDWEGPRPVRASADKPKRSTRGLSEDI